MYSQHNEEEVILDFFGNAKGKFLDVGAHDGETHSNTLALAERGWAGVLMEPGHDAYEALWRRYAKMGNPVTRTTVCGAKTVFAANRFMLIEAAMVIDYHPEFDERMVVNMGAPHPEVITYSRVMLEDVGTGLNTFINSPRVPEYLDLCRDVSIRNTRCYVISIKDLASRMDMEFNMISVDAPGFTPHLAALLTTYQKCQLLCVDRRDADGAGRLCFDAISAAFRLFHETPANMIFVRR